MTCPDRPTPWRAPAPKRLRLVGWLAVAGLAAGGPCNVARAAAPARPVAPTAVAASPAALAVRVQGNHLIDAQGKPLQLRGMSISGLEAVAAQGWNPANPWGGTPDFALMRAWGANVVRLPLNQSSWLGQACTDGAGKSRNPDPGHNYRETIHRAVADATRAGLYVILDLHWNAPAHFCALAQQPMADADNSPVFWTQLAGEFKSQPNVLFELFNEPFNDWAGWGQRAWSVLREGGRQTRYATDTPGKGAIEIPWQSAGMQQLLDAVRATGATNVVLASGLGWSRDLSGWLDARPRDPLQQLAAVWHAYPKVNDVASADATIPLHGADDYAAIEAILAAGFPVLITETGSHNTAGTRGSPLLERLLPWSDARNVSYLGWTFNAWGYPDHVLLKDANGTPSDGYGQYFKAHLACRAALASPCN